MIKKYDKYKDSGVDWIGEIPAGWEIKKFARISYMKGRIGWQGLRQSEFSFNYEDPFLITGMNFKDGKINWKEVYHITQERYEEAPEIQLVENDVLMTKDGTIGKLLFVDKIPYPHKASLNSHLLVLRPLKEAYYSYYLYFQLQSVLFKHHVELTKTGTTFFGITQEAVGQYKILLPPLSEQIVIASFLDRETAKIDQVISYKEELVTYFEEEKTAIINQSVTKGLDPNVRLKPSGIEWLGDIPEHWEVKRLKYLVSKIGSGVTPKGGANVYQLSGIPLLRSQNVHFDGLRLDDVAYITQDVHDDMSNSRVNNGDVLLNITGASIGRCFYADSLLGEANVNQHVCIIRPTTKIDTKYLYFLLRSKVGQNQIVLEQTGSGREGLNFESIKNFIVPMTTFDEQVEIVNTIQNECIRLDSIIIKLKKQIELYREYRTTLISTVVTGKIDVIDEVAL